MTNRTPEELAELKKLREAALKAYSDHVHDMNTDDVYFDTVTKIEARKTKRHKK